MAAHPRRLTARGWRGAAAVAVASRVGCRGVSCCARWRHRSIMAAAAPRGPSECLAPTSAQSLADPLTNWCFQIPHYPASADPNVKLCYYTMVTVFIFESWKNLWKFSSATKKADLSRSVQHPAARCRWCRRGSIATCATCPACHGLCCTSSRKQYAEDALTTKVPIESRWSSIRHGSSSEPTASRRAAALRTLRAHTGLLSRLIKMESRARPGDSRRHRLITLQRRDSRCTTRGRRQQQDCWRNTGDGRITRVAALHICRLTTCRHTVAQGSRLVWLWSGHSRTMITRTTTSPPNGFWRSTPGHL